MGIIQQQAIKGTVYSYIGVAVGFLTTAIIFPKILTTEEIGLLKLLVAYSLLFAQFGSLGFGNVINRLFPYFRNREKGHHGFLTVALAVSLLGFLISWLGLEILKPLIIRNNIENSALFVKYFWVLAPLTFFTLFFNLFDSYIKALYDAVIGTVLKELVQRLLILASVLLYAIDLITITPFVILYIGALSLPTLIILFVLVAKGEFNFRFPDKIFSRQMWNEIASLSFYGVIAGIGSMALLQVDSILVNKFLGISMTGIYATTFFFATIILIPSRPLRKIAVTLVADAWKENNLESIQVIYYKSGITQAIISVLLFVGLWVNIDNIFEIIPRTYEAGKWVIFFVGLANVVEMTFGMSGVIISTSKFYKVNTWFILVFMTLLISSNLILIPVLGLSGAALGVFISTVVVNFLRYRFLKRKFGLWSFDGKTLLLLFIGAISYVAGYLLPVAGNYIVDILIRSSVTASIFISLTLFLKISDDINRWVNGLLRREIF